MINPLRRRNRDRGLTPEQRDEVQKLVFELVQTRLIHAFGPRGLFTVTPHDSTAIDTFFAQAVADTIAWDVAAKLATPGSVSSPIEQVSAALAAAIAAAPAPQPVFAAKSVAVDSTSGAVVADAVVPSGIIADTSGASGETPFVSAEAEPLETEASVSVDTAGVATVVPSRFAPPAESVPVSQVADARAQSTTASAASEPAQRQLVA